MGRKQYESYDYVDPDNEYTYPNSSVLRNKFELRNEDEAREKEYTLVAERLVQLGFFPMEIKSIKDVLATHEYLFQDMYEWVGKYRKVNISKQGNAFMALQAFDTGEEYMDTLLRKFHATANTRGKIAKQLADILDNLNYMHPFREGNGRTQREVIRSLALAKGYYAEIDIDLDDRMYHLYMDGTVYGDLEKLRELFELILEDVEE